MTIPLLSTEHLPERGDSGVIMHVYVRGRQRMDSKSSRYRGLKKVGMIYGAIVLVLVVLFGSLWFVDIYHVANK